MPSRSLNKIIDLLRRDQLASAPYRDVECELRTMIVFTLRRKGPEEQIDLLCRRLKNLGEGLDVEYKRERSDRDWYSVTVWVGPMDAGHGMEFRRLLAGITDDRIPF